MRGSIKYILKLKNLNNFFIISTFSLLNFCSIFFISDFDVDSLSVLRDITAGLVFSELLFPLFFYKKNKIAGNVILNKINISILVFLILTIFLFLKCSTFFMILFYSTRRLFLHKVFFRKKFVQNCVLYFFVMFVFLNIFDSINIYFIIFHIIPILFSLIFLSINYEYTDNVKLYDVKESLKNLISEFPVNSIVYIFQIFPSYLLSVFDYRHFREMISIQGIFSPLKQILLVEYFKFKLRKSFYKFFFLIVIFVLFLSKNLYLLFFLWLCSTLILDINLIHVRKNNISRYVMINLYKLTLLFVSLFLCYFLVYSDIYSILVVTLFTNLFTIYFINHHNWKSEIF